MNKDIYQFEDNLEKATAAGGATDESLDPETAALRETWLAFGKLLEAAQADVPGPPELQYARVEASSPRRPPLGVKTMAALTVLAASLLVAAVVGLLLLQSEAVSVDKSLEIAQTEQSGGQPAAQPQVLPQPMVVEDSEGKNATNNDELDWDDSLDTEIAAAGTEILRIQADRYASSNSSTAIYYRLNAIQQELNDNTL